MSQYSVLDAFEVINATAGRENSQRVRDAAEAAPRKRPQAGSPELELPALSFLAIIIRMPGRLRRLAPRATEYYTARPTAGRAPVRGKPMRM